MIILTYWNQKEFLTKSKVTTLNGSKSLDF